MQSRMSYYVMTTALLMGAISCNHAKEGTALVKGSVNGVTLQAQSALFVSTATAQPGNGSGLGDPNAVANPNTVANPNGVVAAGNSNVAALVRTSAAVGQSLVVTLSNQGDVCVLAGDHQQEANTDYLVLTISGSSALQLGTYTVSSNSPADANVFLPGGLNPNALVALTSAGVRRAAFTDASAVIDSNSATNPNKTKDPNAALNLNTVSNPNTLMPTTGVTVTAAFVQTNNTCVGSSIGAQSGTVTLTQVDPAGIVEGTFNLLMATGDNLAGNFKAQGCAALISSSPTPYACH